MEIITIRGYRKVCKYCGKVLESTSKNAIEHNFDEHLRNCKARIKNLKIKEGGKIERREAQKK